MTDLFRNSIIQEEINETTGGFLDSGFSKEKQKINENIIYSYSKIISDDDWGLLEIIPNKIEHKNPIEIIKICEEDKPKNPKLIDANSQIRKNVLKGFGAK